MKSPEVITDSVEFAKEVSFEMESYLKFKDATLMASAVRIMNQRLWTAGDNVFTVLKADEAYIDVPASPHEATVLPHDSMHRSRVEGPVIQGIAESFRWIGTAGLSTFGLQLEEAEVINKTPEGDVLAFEEQFKSFDLSIARQFHRAFIPIDAIDVQFDMYGSLVRHKYIQSENGQTHELVTTKVPLQLN